LADRKGSVIEAKTMGFWDSLLALVHPRSPLLRDLRSCIF